LLSLKGKRANFEKKGDRRRPAAGTINSPPEKAEGRALKSSQKKKGSLLPQGKVTPSLEGGPLRLPVRRGGQDQHYLDVRKARSNSSTKYHQSPINGRGFLEKHKRGIRILRSFPSTIWRECRNPCHSLGSVFSAPSKKKPCKSTVSKEEGASKKEGSLFCGNGEKAIPSLLREKGA